MLWSQTIQASLTSFDHELNNDNNASLLEKTTGNSSGVGTSKRVFDLVAGVGLLVLLGLEEFRAFNLVNLHEFLSGLRHWVPSVLAHVKPLMEILHLLVLLDHVFNILARHLSCLRDLTLAVSSELALSSLIIGHG